MSVTQCPSCSTPVPPGSVFCDNCGYDLRTVAPAAQAPAAQAPQYQAPPVSGGLTCPVCGHANVAGSAFCENCGAQLPAAVAPAAAPVAPPVTPQAAQPAAPQPSPIPPPSPAYTPPPSTPIPTPAPAPAVPISAISGRLVIQSSNVSLPIPQGKQTVVIGREDPVSGIFPDIDLDPYGAQEQGVGRRHAQLVLQSGQICLEDLESVNGTVLNKQRVAPRQPQPIKDGDELRLGKMILIYFRN